MIDLFKDLIHKLLVEPKLLQLKNCIGNNQTGRAPDEIYPVFNDWFKRLRIFFAANETVTPEVSKKKVVDILLFSHPGSKKRNQWKHTLVVWDFERRWRQM